MNRKTAACLTAALLTAACGPASDPECYQRPVEKDGPWILSDHYHARKQNQEDYFLDKDTYGYQGVFGFRRVFDHVERGGYNWTSIREMDLSPERLEGFDTLFINLVSNDRPDFTDDEVQTIMDFVEDGGGLFVIADHTNVYDHAERVNRFLVPMGIEVLYSIAVDYPPEHSVAGLGWILVDDFADHPVTQDLKMISLQTGGAMEGGGVAFSSDESFADFWDPEDTGGYYGNWEWDGDAEVEPQGPLEVHSAVEFGDGRVVVAGDQNMFGDAWAHWGDNFEVFANSMEWVSKQDGVGETPLRDLKPIGTLIALDQSKNGNIGGKQGDRGMFSFFTSGNRDREITTRGSIRLENEEDALVFADPNVEFTDGEFDAIREYLRAGKPVVLTFDPQNMYDATVQFLGEFAPDFTWSSGGADLDFTPDAAERVEGMATPIASGIDPGFEFATYVTDPRQIEEDEPEPVPYMFDVTSDWGSPLLRAEVGGKEVDVIRSKTVDGGELILMMQGGLFQNRSLGGYLRRPGDEQRGATLVQYALMDHLKIENPPMPENDRDENPASRVCE